ncbi:hypothetical protein M406DRAFT_70182 [Cryphonectria parasitica EP155]|uniref:AB hydrolase-1 domain-containing protein n=1 Tax=Cryphonectria parasitica (strain ATCC 38755 / EP155) TaxID=660469 RepID=A0A9P4Y6Y1_CRYP1|nr:uncharacterized protein M406DRAFT_70182 [Cryphonectria parasitica EP155]KAF3768084.1 hypothetical protein M406DRAFT_70182 [Cryphonectria parasitica EP155]
MATSNTTNPQVLSLPDGRNLEYTLSGAQDGFPFVFIHGTVGACCPNPTMSAVCAAKGIRLITPSRPGYGASTRRQGRQVVDFVEDMKTLLDYLGVKRCVVAGYSGGGPHGIACAARLPGCVAALVIAGGGPTDAEDLDYGASHGESNLEEYEAMQKGEEAVREYCLKELPGMTQSDAKGLTEELSSILPEVDKKALLENDSLAQYLVDQFQHGLGNGVDGWIDDDLELMQPWGFQLHEVRVPIHVYQGDLDKMVPPSHGEWFATHLPEKYVKPHLLEGEGHISLYLKYMDEILDLVLTESKA